MTGRERVVPSLKRARIIRARRRAGFVTLRQRGSHEFLHHPDGRRLTLALHPSSEAGPSLVRKIIRDAGMSASEFLDLL
jgi:predicted RNA binding protein YcfA (HicA-like mRNA interferase family)